MSKEEEARVRDELLQGLYRDVLRCERAAGRNGSAAAAGVCANLRPGDLLLLPARGAGGFRPLRAGCWEALPRGEAAGVRCALQAAARLPEGSLACVVLPPGASFPPASPQRRMPETWAGAGAYAARRSLPLLLIGGRPTPAPDPAAPAPPYPSIPVDGEDALAVYRVAYECAARARLHPPAPSRIVPAAFRIRGAPPEPPALARLESALRRRGAFSKAWARKVEREVGS